MSRRLRGICIAALFSSLSASTLLGAPGESAGLAEQILQPGMPRLLFDGEPFTHPSAEVWRDASSPREGFTELTEFTAADLSIWPTNAVPHANPVAPAFEAEKPAAREDLLVPVPAIGAGWLLIISATLYKLGRRAIRPI